MNTYTQTHIARPSRVQIARALLAHWYNRNAHTFALAYVGAIVATFAIVTAVAMRVDMGASMSHAVAVAVLVVGVALFAAMLAYMLATSRAEEMQSEHYARTIAELEEQNKKMTRDYSEAMHYLNDTCDELQACQQALKNEYANTAKMQNEKEDYVDALSAALTELEIVRDALQATTKRPVISDDDYIKGKRVYTITLSAPKEYDERVHVDAKISDGLQSVEVQGFADYYKNKSTAETKRDAYVDALEAVAYELPRLASN